MNQSLVGHEGLPRRISPRNEQAMRASKPSLEQIRAILEDELDHDQAAGKIDAALTNFFDKRFFELNGVRARGRPPLSALDELADKMRSYIGGPHWASIAWRIVEPIHPFVRAVKNKDAFRKHAKGRPRKRCVAGVPECA